MQRVALIIVLLVVLAGSAVAQAATPHDSRALQAIAQQHFHGLVPVGCSDITLAFGDPSPLFRAGRVEPDGWTPGVDPSTGRPYECVVHINGGLAGVDDGTLCPIYVHEYGHLLGYEHKPVGALDIMAEGAPDAYAPLCKRLHPKKTVCRRQTPRAKRHSRAARERSVVWLCD